MHVLQFAVLLFCPKTKQCYDHGDIKHSIPKRFLEQPQAVYLLHVASGIRKNRGQREASVLTCSPIVHLIAPLKVDLSSACCVSVREVYVGPLQQCRSEGSCHAVSWAEPALYTNGVFSAWRPWMQTSRSAHVIQKSLWHLRQHQRHQFSAERSRA